MKTYWSAFLFITLFFILAGCSKEQFGVVPKATTKQAEALKSFESSSCSTFTLIKPKVDILYLVDNSTSTYYVANDIKAAIKGTVDHISRDFDYRAIGTPLLQTSGINNDFQILTNSNDLQGIPSDSRRIFSANDFNFFTNTVSRAEEGLGRAYSFVNAHISDGLFRKGAYLLIVLISNGRDTTIEQQSPYNDSSTVDQSVYNSRKSNFLSLKTALQSQQLRLISVTAQSACQSGWFSSLGSYVAMSKDLYISSGASDQIPPSDSTKPFYPDSYDLCGGNISSIFTTVNNAIKQVIEPHTYKYWPITFAENNETVSLSEIKVYKVSPNGSQTELPKNTTWTYFENTSGTPVNTRILPSVGEPISGRHFIQFTSNNYITYPDCISVRSVSRTEYFGFIALSSRPVESSIIVKINGRDIPKSTSNGWSYLGNSFITRNLKVPYPNPGDENPPVMGSGFMIQLNGPDNYYKSGEDANVYFQPAPL